MLLTTEHHKFIVEAYFRSGVRNENNEWEYSYESCYEQFVEHFPCVQIPRYMFVQNVRRMIIRFRDTGSVSKRKSEIRKRVLTDETINDIRERLEINPNKSLRQLSAQCGISYGSCRTACQKILHFNSAKTDRNDGDNNPRRKRKGAVDVDSSTSEPKLKKSNKISNRTAPIEEVLIKTEHTDEPIEEVFINHEHINEPVVEITVKEELIDEPVKEIVIKEECLDDYPHYSQEYKQIQIKIKTEEDEENYQAGDQSS